MRTFIYPSSNQILEAIQRPELAEQDLQSIVKKVFDDVRSNGDEALYKYTLQFDKVELTDFEVSQNEFNEAQQSLSEDLKSAILQAAENIRAFHARQYEEPQVIETMPGVRCWRKSVPIERVGLYIPGGTAPLFSTVLMLAIPASIAGCKEITLCSPAGADGKIHPAILFAASTVGVTRVLKLGGIQAIAALAVGTKSIDSCYKIFGPGNQYVTASKKYAQQLGVAIDMPAGPSEVMVVADEVSNADFIAADLLSQAEHGADSQVVLLSTSQEKVVQVQEALKVQLKELSRNEFAAKALGNSSAIVVQKEELLSIINQYAPEHLILQTEFNEELLPGIVNAGSVFLGPFTPESAGDYASGTNHTLPTNGYARMYSGVSLDSFIKKITFQEISRQGLQNIGRTIEVMADAEGLDAHRNAVTIRLQALEK
ncbi:MAG: histidinol dehydrogenase [Bacteroidota bacterium]